MTRLTARVVASLLLLTVPFAGRALGAADACSWKTALVPGPLMQEVRAGHTATLMGGLVLIAGGSSATTASPRAEVVDLATGVGSVVGAMGTARYFHTATLLPITQRVLVAGGSQGAMSHGVTASAELYDPASRTFTPTAPLSAARWFHTATPVQGGAKVLLAGGQAEDGTALATTELYDVASGTITVAGPLGTGRWGHTATLLPDGSVLAVGGRGASGLLDTAEIFLLDATGQSGAWHVVAVRLPRPRWGHAAATFGSGAVLISGGEDDHGAIDTAEQLLPGGGTVTRGLTVPMTSPRFFHTATTLPTGEVLVAGGYDAATKANATVELFVPGRQSFQVVGALPAGRANHAAVGLPNGQVLLTGGFDEADRVSLSTSLFDPFWAAAAHLSVKRVAHTATLLGDGRVLLAGGTDGLSAVQATADLFTPSDGSISQVWMKSERAFHAATRLDGQHVLLTGGKTAAGKVLDTAEIFDAATNTFTSTASTPRVHHDAALLPTGDVLLSGGQDASWNVLSSTEVFHWDPASGQGTFTSGPPMYAGRALHTATRAPGGAVYLAGGYGTDVAGATTSVERYDAGLLSGSGRLHTERLEHQALALDGEDTVLLAGGLILGPSGVPTASFERYPGAFCSPNHPETCAYANMVSARYHHALAATGFQPPRFMAVGGRDSFNGPPLASAEYLVATIPLSARAAPDLPTARALATATLLADGRILVAGGEGASSDTAVLSKSTACSSVPPPPPPRWFLSWSPAELPRQPWAYVRNVGRARTEPAAVGYTLVSLAVPGRQVEAGRLSVPALAPGARHQVPEQPPGSRLPGGRWSVRACLDGGPGRADSCFTFERPLEIVPKPGPVQFPRAWAGR